MQTSGETFKLEGILVLLPGGSIALRSADGAHLESFNVAVRHLVGKRIEIVVSHPPALPHGEHEHENGSQNRGE